MSTENMRKLMMLAESLDEDYRDDPTCQYCHGWGEWIDPEGFDEPVPCPHCDPDNLDEERDYHEEWVQHFVDMGKSKLWSLYNQTLEDDDYPGRTDELQHMEDALERMGIVVAESEGEDDLGPAAQGKSDVVKQVADEEGWDVEDFPLAEGEERPYICVHAKKGKHECYADTSYAAAKKAAEHWGLKSTAGIDAHLAIDEDTLEESFDDDEKECGVCGKKFEWEGSPDEEMCPRCTKEYLGEESCPCGREDCECGPDCDCEPVEEMQEISLSEIAESILNERGLPKDYEMSDEELAAEIEDQTSEFDRDFIDPEIEDEELGLRFD